jgi:hypothetical protein
VTPGPYDSRRAPVSLGETATLVATRHLTVRAEPARWRPAKGYRDRAPGIPCSLGARAVDALIAADDAVRGESGLLRTGQKTA